MDDTIGLIIGLLVIALLIGSIVLPIVALVISISTRNKLNQAISRMHSSSPATSAEAQGLSAIVQQLITRVARLEVGIPVKPPSAPTTETRRPPTEERPHPPAVPPTPAAQPPRVAAPPTSTAPAPPMFSTPAPARTINAQQIESIIGRRWLGWAAIALILFATAFFLKYAFDNRWIGELGRVAIGVAAGVTFTALGYRYHRRKWRVFSQILTGGGVVLLYLSVYASFAYYHLATQKTAFIFLALLITEAAALALLYDAPAIAVMALVGGFLVPILLRSDRDQYRSLFGYIFALDVGTLGLMKHWPGLSSLAFLGTHLLFWLWYGENYHPRKLAAVMTFQTAVFLAFLLAHLVRRFLKQRDVEFDDLAAFTSDPFKFITSFEDFSLLLVNPFVFFATAYFFLNPDHHDWMGAFAIGMALVYAGVAKLLLDRRAATRKELLLMIGVALTFVTLSIPIQLKSNWITMAWAVEGLVILWAGIEMESQRLRAIAHALFTLALLKLVFWDTPWGDREPFTPVANKYFLSSLFVTACLFAAALVYEKLGERKKIAARVFQLVLLIAALITLWFLMTIETHTYFAVRAALQKTAEDYQHERWLGQMALSVLWSIYAAVLAAVGFVRRAPAVRWAALSLFALTVIKVMLIDIAVLKQLYRIIAFLVLGLLLLVVTWGYHKAFHSKESST
ncbi:MAG TPA: DUF2339 domain-containing protein [Pyrinomonadaceae bacterium]|nr:DUF2339 domain-containing protein [Pyrinomonadaceae bacterium]